MAVGLGRVFEILDLPQDIVDAPDAVPMQPFASDVRFRGVMFGYRPARPVLQELDLTLGAARSSLCSALLAVANPP